MENATKALLIAASVLIVIVLIALGVGLLNSTNNTSDQAKNASNLLGNSSSEAIDSVTAALNKYNNSTPETISVDIHPTEFGGRYATITAEKNMTWQEFANSTYNNIGLKINASGYPIIEIEGTNYYLYNFLGGKTIQKKDMTIQGTSNYVVKPNLFS